MVCILLDSPKVLYLRHHGATSGGWTQNSLCMPCFRNYRPRLDPFVSTSTDSSSCRCHVCLRQTPPLLSLASYTVFQITNNYLNSRCPHKLCINTIYVLWNPISFPSIGWFNILFLIFAARLRVPRAVVSLSRFTKPAQTLLNFPGTLSPGNTVPPRMRLVLAFVRTRINGGVICVLTHSSQLQALCSASCVPHYICKICMQ